MSYDPTHDPLASHGGAADAPARRASAITPNDGADLTTYAKALRVGAGGALVVLPVRNSDGATVTLLNVADGEYVPIQVRRVLATGTTATGILALFD